MGAARCIDGRFDVIRLAGEGGMGRVYQATDRLDGGTVAVKVLHDDGGAAIGRFAREIRLLSGLRHPGLVRYVAHGITQEGEPYLAMEWLTGETLAARLERAEVSVGESVAMALSIARALGAVHRAGVVHRDLKPSNVFLVDGALDRPVLIDFGVARAPEEAGYRITSTGALVGTPGYMAPEQVRGDRRVDARADVFALGCVLFRCLTGRDAFAGEGSLAVMFKVVLEDPPRVLSLRPRAPRELDELCARMLAKERASRVPDAEAVVTALEALEAPVAGTRFSVAPAGGPPSQLTGQERRFTCMLMVRDAGPVRDGGDPHTPNGREAQDALVLAVERAYGRMERLADGALLVVLDSAGSPTDVAARAARCAFAVRDALGGAPVSLSAGPVDGEARRPAGDAIERAARLLTAAGERGASSPIRVDEVTAGLLGERFDVRPERGTLALHGEREELDTGRRLLGRPTTCLGRERELGLLDALFVHCAEDSAANAAVITGEAGVGKSRVRHELLRRLRERGERFEVWVGYGDPMSAGSAFAVLARAVRSAAGIVESDGLEQRRAMIRRCVAALPEPERAAAFLGELSGAPLPDGASAQLRAARADPVLMGDQMRRAAEDLMRAACGRGTLILVLDDLQWGDLPTVTFVDAALRNLADLPLLVLALGRPELAALFPRLWHDRAPQAVRLPPLPRRAAERLVRHGLGETAPAPLVAALVERAGGNAFYLEELTRAVVSGEDGASRPGHHASRPADPRLELPATVLAMAQARLEAIDPELRRVLRAASIFGRTFSMEGVEALLGGASIGPRLGELLAGELLVRHGDGAPDYGFRHALVREAAYGMLTEEDRGLGHRLAGAWLEGTGKGDAMALAEHFERGGEPSRAATFYRRAAEEALAGNDLAAALHRAARGAACGAGREDLGALRLVEAEAHLWRGELALSEARGDEAAALLAAGSSPWFRAITQAVFAASKQGAVDRIGPHAEAAVAVSPAAGAESARVLCLSACAGELTFAGRLEAGDALFVRLTRFVAEGPPVDPQALGTLLHSRALRAMAAGNLGAALGSFEEAAAALDKAGDRRTGCNARANLGFVYVELGGFAEGESALRAAHAEAERLGLFELAATALQNLGYALFHEGRLPEARAFVERSIATLAPLGSARLTGSARTYLARIHLGAGDAVAAEREARAAAHLLGTAPGLRAVALAVAARALAQQGRPGEALAAAEQAFALLEATGGSLEEGESLVRLVHAEALTAAGRASEARAALASARRRLEARAACISDPVWRARFLSEVPDNAATVAAAIAG